MSLTKLRSRVSSWVERHIVAEDPNPEYSRLDRMNGLGSPDLTAEWEAAVPHTANVHQFPVAEPAAKEEQLAA